MRRALGFTGAWFMTTVVAMGVTWLACAVVLNGHTPPAPTVTADLQAVDSARLPAPVDTRSYPAPQASGTGRAVPPPRPTPTRVSRDTRPAEPGTPVSLPGRIPVVVRFARPPEPTAPPQPTPTPTPSGGARPQPRLQQIQTTGGTAWIGFSDSGVAVLSLQPADGFTWSIVQEAPGALLVVLSRDGDQFDVYAGWAGGPTASITEYRW
jgi:hypothetical protein